MRKVYPAVSMAAIAFVFFIFSVQQAQAQAYAVATYTNAGNPGGLSSDGTTTTGWTSITSGTQSANGWSTAQTLPFPFDFFGTAVTQFKVSQNMVLTFDVATSTVPGDNTALPSAGLPDLSIAGMWDAFTVSPPTGSNDLVYVKTFGTAPNRQFWVRWYSFEYSSTSYQYSSIVLEEGTNKIYVVDEYGSTSSPTTTVGVQNTALEAVQIAGSPNISPAANGTSITDNDYWEFTPQFPCTSPPNAGTAISSDATACAGSNFILSLSGATSGSGQTYQWESSSDNTTWSAVAGATGASLSTSQTVSSYYRAAVTCGGNTQYSTSVQVLTPALVSGNFTIDGGAPTGGNNFQTFTEAINYIKCGINGPVVFDVMPYTYSEQVVIPEIYGTSATNTIRFKGNLGTISFSSASSTARAGILLDGADHVIIDSLIIDGSTGSYCWNIALTNKADSNTISNCVLINNTSATTTNYIGIAVNGSATGTASSGNNGSGNRFLNNSITGGYYGVYLYGNSSSQVQNNNNELRGNLVKDFYLYGTYAFYQSSGLVISKNNYSRPARSYSTSSTTYVIYLSTGNHGALVEKNRIHNMYDAMPSTGGTTYGIYVTADATNAANILANNLIYNIGGNATVYGIADVGGDSLKAYHNTIAIDDQVATTGAAYGFYQSSTANGVDFKNNIVYISRSGTGNKRAIWLNATASTVESDHNVLAVTSASGTSNLVGQYGSTTYATIIDWKTANGGIFDQASSGADPFFTNPSAGEYVPTEPAINGIGTYVGITTDIVDSTRNTASPDPGAFKFSIGGCINPPVPGNATATVTDVCPGADFGLDLMNNSYGDGQTYQWQSSPNDTNWTNIGSPMLSPVLTTSQTATTYYRVAVKCYAGTVVYSTSVMVTSPPLVSGSFTIDGGMPTGAGNFQTFADALNHLKCGINGPVVFNVAPYTYNERVVFTEIPGASATNTVTFKGNMATISFNATTSAMRAGVVFDGADHITIDSLIIDGSSGTYCWNVALTNQADSNTISNCVLINNTTSTLTNYVGIAINGSVSSTGTSGNNGNGNRILNNSITGGYYGIYLYGNSGSQAQNTGNEVRGNVIKDFYLYGTYAIYQSDGLVISHNEYKRPVRSYTTSSTTYTIYLGTNTRGALAEKNRIHHMYDAMSTTGGTLYGVYASADATNTRNVVANNLMYTTGGNATTYGIAAVGSDSLKVYHNTIALDDQTATTGGAYGLYQSTTAKGVEFKNNLVYINRSGTGIKRAIWLNTTTSSVESDHNILVMASTGGTSNMTGRYGTTTYASLADWQTANSGAFDQNSVAADPAFTSPSTGEYIPNTSAVNNTGVDVGITTDIRDSARNASSPDAGAYEFSNLTAGINMMADGLTGPVVNNNGCYTNAEQVSIRIRNTSTSTIDFAATPVTVTVNVTGAVTQTLVDTLDSGTLGSDSVMVVTFSTPLDMTTAGTYTFNASTSVSGDVNTANDAMLPVTRTKTALTAGNVSGPSGYCVYTPVNPTLTSTGYAGQDGLQWYSSVSLTGGYAAISGADSTPYTTTSGLTQTMYYKLVATCGTENDTSAVVTVQYNEPQVMSVTPGARCEPGQVILGATGSAGSTLEWYTDSTGVSTIGSGSSFSTPFTNTTTEYYVSAVIAGGGAAVAVQITEADLGGTDGLEIQNVSPSPVDVTGWKVAISNSYTSITSVNSIIQTLSGVMAPGETKFWVDASGANYWGNNMFWNPGDKGWAALLDNNDNLVDIIFFNWLAADIQSASITIGSAVITPSAKWTGQGFDGGTATTGLSISKQGALDNNNAGDFAAITSSLGSSNAGLTIPMSGFSCNSPRAAVTATINPAASSAAGTTDSTECVTANVSGFTEFHFGDCDAMAVVDPGGTTPLNGNVSVCVSIDSSVQQTAQGEPYVARHYDITPAVNAATATYFLKLFYLQNEFDSFNLVKGFYGALPAGLADAAGIANLRITQYNGSGTAPGNYTGAAVQIDPTDANVQWNASMNRWEISIEVTGSGGFYVHSGNFVLPVTFTRFDGELAGEQNRLFWTTAIENRNQGFEVQRSTDGTTFSKIGFVASKAPGGNSGVSLDYQFNDKYPVLGKNYYRLRQVDLDGKQSFSNTIVLVRNTGISGITRVYPNPVHYEIRFEYFAPQAELLTIRVLDITGRVVKQQPLQVNAGMNKAQLNLSALTTGTYVLQAVSSEGAVQSMRFVKE